MENYYRDPDLTNEDLSEEDVSPLSGTAKTLQDYLTSKLSPLIAKDKEKGDYTPVNLTEVNDAPLRLMQTVGSVADVPASYARRGIYNVLGGEDKDEVSGHDIIGQVEKNVGAPVPEMPGATLKMKDALGLGTEIIADPLILGAGAYTKAGKEAIELAKRAPSEFAKKYPGFTQRLLDNRGSLDLRLKRELSKLKNPTEEEVRKILEIGPIQTSEQFTKTRGTVQDFLEFVGRERLGIPESTSKEQSIEKALESVYPEIKETGLPVNIEGENLGTSGQFEYDNFRFYPNIANPKKIVLFDPKNPIQTSLHEGQHFRDFLKYAKHKPISDEFVPMFLGGDLAELVGSERAGYLAHKLRALRPNLSEDEALKIMSNLITHANENNLGAKWVGQQILDMTGDRYYDFTTGRHFVDYPINFELKKGMELLNPDMPIEQPKLKANYDIIKSIWDDVAAKKATLTPKEFLEQKVLENAEKEYVKRNFPNIEEILKKK